MIDRRFLIMVVVLTGLLVSGGLTGASPRNPMHMDFHEVAQPAEGVIIEAIGAEGEGDIDGDVEEEDALGVDPAELALAHYIWTYNHHLTPPQYQYLARQILRFSYYYGLDYRLVAGMIAVESSFRPNAVSRSGAIGLGQLKPATAQWLGVLNPYNPADNIAGMARYLRYLLKKYDGDTVKAVSAYYQGPGTIDRQGITPKCRPYLKKVRKAMKRFDGFR